jgi:A/G-specific adenine glycosylase
MSNINPSRSFRKQILTRILDWYTNCGRSLPWRQNSDPYRVWLSEVMLQQTQVDTVIPYYLRFLSRFPDIRTLAEAPLGDVLKAWENLGYYRRAHNLHQAAGVIVERFSGRVPETMDGLMALPGVGSYTAAAILSIAFGEAVAAVDGNIRRIICRLFAIAEAPEEPAVQERIAAYARSLVPTDGQAGSFNQALMDLGATVCTARSPRCDACPIRNECLAWAQGKQDVLPLKTKRKAVPQRQGVAGILLDGQGRVLVVQRPEQGLLASLWKFPGGMLEGDESPEAGLQRTVKDELGLYVKPERPVAIIKHAYTHFRLILHVWSCRDQDGAVQALQCQQWKWIAPYNLSELPFSKADSMVISSVPSIAKKARNAAGRGRRRAGAAAS